MLQTRKDLELLCLTNDVSIFFPQSDYTFHLFSQVITEKAAQTTIHLLMQDASATDSGVFECIPDNAPPAKVKVHILTAGNIVWLKIFLVIFEIAKNGIWLKKIFMKLIDLIS